MLFAASLDQPFGTDSEEMGRDNRQQLFEKTGEIVKCPAYFKLLGAHTTIGSDATNALHGRVAALREKDRTTLKGARPIG